MMRGRAEQLVERCLSAAAGRGRGEQGKIVKAHLSPKK
jgi:hypothetical protein